MNSESSSGCSGGGCEEALAELEAFLDGELPETRLKDIEQHLSACYPCTDRASFEEKLRSIVRRECIDEPPPSLVLRIREHLGVPGGNERG